MSTLFRWVGSKQWIKREIAAIVRNRLGEDCTYWEPFIGSGSVLFTLHDIGNACICDSIEPLIRTYKAIKDDPIKVWTWANLYGSHGINSYYKLRKVFNNYLLSEKNPQSDHEFAGLFIYMNACCFNGLWRQNQEGKFNVPASDRKNVKIPKQRTFIVTSQILQKTNIRIAEPPSDVFDVIDESHLGDVIFADPPYYETFDGYDGLLMTGEGFHERLASTLHAAHERGVYVIAMNSDTKFIRKLYHGWSRIKKIKRHQTISGQNSGRGEWSQLLITGK